MRILKLIPPVLVGLVLLCAAYFALVFSTPARAQECPLLVADIPEKLGDNGELIEVVDLRSLGVFQGKVYNKLIVARIGEGLTVGLAFERCVISPPLQIAVIGKAEGA